MTDTQPEALRLADRLSTGIIDREGDDTLAAAAELRRLHKENESLRASVYGLYDLEKLNGELVDVLSLALDCMRFDPDENPGAHALWTHAKTTLAKATGSKQ